MASPPLSRRRGAAVVGGGNNNKRQRQLKAEVIEEMGTVEKAWLASIPAGPSSPNPKPPITSAVAPPATPSEVHTEARRLLRRFAASPQPLASTPLSKVWRQQWWRAAAGGSHGGAVGCGGWETLTAPALPLYTPPDPPRPRPVPADRPPRSQAREIGRAHV